MRTTALAPAVLAAAALVAGCGSDDEPERAAPAPPASTAAPDPGGPAADSATVVIEDFLYAPKTVRVKAGADVRFENRDTAPHTATISEGATKFDSGTIEKRQNKTVTFDEPGTYDYLCLFHPYMKGTVTVEG
jgi:plastocyanin